ncbi:winged helix-turn-helix domain-containing protein [Rhodococcus sp. NPDC003348]
MTVSQIDALVGTHSEATTHQIPRWYSEDPSLLNESPTEVIDQRAAGFIGDTAMMNRLLSWSYSFGHSLIIDGVATDAYTSGDWDEIERAYYCRRISDDELAKLFVQNESHLRRSAQMR